MFAVLGAKDPRGLVVYGPIFWTQAELPFLNASSTPFPPLVIPRSEHSISRAAISPNALKVLYRLKDAGYQGFLVGGAVRDLLLGQTVDRVRHNLGVPMLIARPDRVNVPPSD